jgi:MATE family multidrug resistance protein
VLLKIYLPYYGRLLKLALPLVLTQAGQLSIQLIDNAMVGRYGTDELAAAAFANNIYLVVMLLGMGVFIGITPLIGHARGSKHPSHVSSLIKSGFGLSVFLIPCITLIAWSVIWILPHMGQTDEVVRLAVPYYRTLVVAIVPFLLFALLKQIGEGLGNTFVAMVATLVANLIKVVLNYALIFGNLGFSEMGLMGAGYATIASRIAMPLMIFAGFMALKPIRHYFSLVHKVKSTFREIMNILRIGVPIAVQHVLEVSAFSVSAVMMGWMGNVPLASHEIAIGLAAFTFMAANGVAMATTIRVSFQLGARNYLSLKRVSVSAVHLVLVFMGICGLCFLIFRHELPLLFTADKSVIIQTAALLAVAALFQIFDGLQVVCLGILRGFADVKVPMFIAVISYTIIGLPVSYLCAFQLKLGPEGIWYGFLVGLSLAGILLFLRIRKKIRGVSI